LVSEWGFEDDPHFGQTTYEFADSTDVFYGLRQINNSWLALFNPSENILEYLILNRRPLGLEITADHDKNISEIKFKLRKGTRIWLGELVHADFSRDTDGDGVPDIFEEDYDPSIVLDMDFNNEDEAQNIAHDRSPNHNNGTIYGASWVDGKVGRALDFNGIDNYVELTSLPFTGAVDATLEAWIKFTAGAEAGFYRKIICLGNQAIDENIQIYKEADGDIAAGVWGRGPVNARQAALNDGKYHHIVGVFKGGTTVSLYVDGIFIGSDTQGYNVTEGATTAKHIGGRIDGDYWLGIIDEVRIYNRVLSANEIKERFNLGKLKRVSVPRLVKKMGYAGW